MLYLAQALLPWLLAALVLGLGVGWWSCRQRPPQAGGFWLTAIIAGFVIGCLLSVLTLLPGRAGLWLDTALLFVFWYFSGCCLGCVFGRFGAQEPVPAAAVVGSSVTVAAPASTQLAAPAAAASPRHPWQATRAADTVTMSGSVSSEDARRRIVAAAEQALPGATIRDLMRTQAEAPDTLEPMAAAAFGHLAGLDRGIASLIGGRYTLTGVASSGADADAIAADAKVLPPGFVLDRVDIAQALVRPVIQPVIAHESPPLPSEEAMPGERPPTLPAARGGKPDDLKRIRGIGRQNEQKLNGFGVFHFDQIAAWTADEALWTGAYLAFPGRIEREGWIDQARQLADGQETEFSKRVARGEVETSRSDGEPPLDDAVTAKPRGDRKPKA